MPLRKTTMMLNSNGSAFHLHAFTDDIAPVVLLVGDPGRVALITQHFDKIDVRHMNREFVLETGWLGKKRITVISTGISTSNIDIVINELDQLINIDLKTSTIKENIKSLFLFRLGTSGALQEDIPVGSLVISEYAFAWDGLLKYYGFDCNADDKKLFLALQNHFNDFPMTSNLYLGRADKRLFNLLKGLGHAGITFTACGFYGPQGRFLRAGADFGEKKNIIKISNQFSFENKRITNFEMESSAIYGFSNILGHRCCTINTILANRINDAFISDYHPMVENMIVRTLEIISAHDEFTHFQTPLSHPTAD